MKGASGEFAQVAKAIPTELVEKVTRLVERQKQLEKQVEELEKRKSAWGKIDGTRDVLSLAREITHVKVLALRTEVRDRGALRELAEQLRDKLGKCHRCRGFGCRRQGAAGLHRVQGSYRSILCQYARKIGIIIVGGTVVAAPT